jgi:hypothetical protein
MADGDFPNRYGAHLTSRSKFSAEVDDVRDTPARPFAQGEVLRKLYYCARGVLRDETPERLAAAVDRLEHSADLTVLTSALRRVRCAGWAPPATGARGPVEAVKHGVDEVRRAVRRQVKGGVDWIKVLASGVAGSR